MGSFEKVYVTSWKGLKRPAPDICAPAIRPSIPNPATLLAEELQTIT
jgi:hypothetical protein